MTEPITMPDLKEILIVKTGLPPDAIGDDPSVTFADLGLDSLAFLQLQTVIDNRYGVELDVERQGDTLGELLDQINAGRVERVGDPA